MKFRILPALVATAAVAAVAASPAIAAKVDNGDFETGDLSGWNQQSSLGTWFTYDAAGAGDFPPPPQGEFAAVADQDDPGSQILYQDVRLKQGKVHKLNFTTYYQNNAGDVFITPDTFSIADENQQYSADVLRGGADPGAFGSDRLLQLFRTEPGDPEELAPTQVKEDLSLLGGKRVRLRFGVAVTEEILNAGLDDVRVKSKKAPKCDGEKPTIVGTNGDEKIKGTRKNDVIVGRGGDDKVKGRGGEDILCGDAGRDNLNGGKSGDFCDPGGGPGRARKCEL